MQKDVVTPESLREMTQKPKFVAIPIKNMRTDAILDAELFIKIGYNQYVKYRERNFEFNWNIRKRLRENRHTHVFVKIDDMKSLDNYLEENLKNTLNDQKIDLHEKTELLYETTTYLVRGLLENPSSKDGVKQSRRIVESTAEFILSSSEVLSHHLELSSVDYYTYTHSVDVMTYSILLGKRMGIKEGSEINNLGHGALLHDIGKMYVDPLITQKNGSLTEEEFTEMKKHPVYGYNVLKKTDELSDGVLNIVLHHHEDLLGTGYPDGIDADEIGLDVRIVTVSDIFDALTTKRVYRKSYQNFRALKMMKDIVGKKIDEKVFRGFVRMLGNV